MVDVVVLRVLLVGPDDRRVGLEGSLRCDVCVVGGGFTGLWTALRLKELDSALDVIVVERDVCGAGASGRNGGFVLSWWAKFASLRKVCGTEEALRLGRLLVHLGQVEEGRQALARAYRGLQKGAEGR